MLGLIGIKKNVPLEIREMLAIKTDKREKIEEEFSFIFDEFLILSTCNRTEIYFKAFDLEVNLEKIFSILSWDLKFSEYVFYFREEKAVKHLFEVVCGFHSKIYGEDQILGQIRDSYFYSKERGFLSIEFNRLFQEAISLGKKFREKSNLYKIPVSSSSIVANLILNSNSNSIMIIGFGDVSKKVFSYLSSKFTGNIFIVVRNKKKVNVNNSNVKVISFSQIKDFLKEVDTIVSATSSNNEILFKDHFKESKNEIVIYDLALPRDVEGEVGNFKNINLFNIDEISKIDDENKKIRKDIMNKNRYLVFEYLEEFIKWKELRKIVPNIKELKEFSNSLVEERYRSFVNKNNSSNVLAKKMLNSLSNLYLNNAIDLLKKETIEGRGEECLRIIEEIFLKKN